MKVVDRFKRRILDLAIRGKLVPQDPNDEPATELLARIRAEKTKDERGGRGRKGKRSAVGSDGAAYEKSEQGDLYHTRRHEAGGTQSSAPADAPFELPDGWAWCRLGNLTTLITSGSRSWAQFYSHDQNDPLFLRMGNLSRNSFSLRLDDLQHVRLPEGAEGTRTAVLSGDLLFSITAEIGMMGLIPKDFPTAFINQHTALIRFYDAIKGRFIPYALLSSFAKEQYASRKHGMKISFRLDSIEDVLIPLPPLSEQKRIVARIEELFEAADSLGRAADGLAEAAKRLDRKILDLAIRGKLVAQDPTDEPASELLKRIAAASHKSPCQNHEVPIAPPFEIPKLWEWVWLKTICDFYLGKTPPRANQQYWIPPAVPWVTISDMTQHGHITQTKEGVSSCAITKGASGRISTKGTLLMSFKLTIGKVAILDCDATHNEAIISILPYCDSSRIMRNYLFETLPFLVGNAEASPAIMGDTLNKKTLGNLRIPLPPLEEQKRIVSKIEELRKATQIFAV